MHNTSNPAQDSALALKAALALLRVLSHKIRTHLSVISNDLNYFKNMLETAECERGIERCGQIAALFKPIHQLCSPEKSEDCFDLVQLLKQVFAEKFSSEKSEGYMIRGARGNLRQAFEWMSEYIAPDSVKIKENSSIIIVSLIQKSAASEVDSSGCFPGEKFQKTDFDLLSQAESPDHMVMILTELVLHSFSGCCRRTSSTEYQIVFGAEY